METNEKIKIAIIFLVLGLVTAFLVNLRIPSGEGEVQVVGQISSKIDEENQIEVLLEDGTKVKSKVNANYKDLEVDQKVILLKLTGKETEYEFLQTMH